MAAQLQWVTAQDLDFQADTGGALSMQTWTLRH